MLSEKNIVVTIGNYGAIVALHSGGKIEEHAFLDDLNDDARTQIANICSANSKAPLYVLLDTVDQSYKKKIYPAVRRSDLTRIVKRDLAIDGDSTSLRGYMVTNTKKSNTKQSKQPGSNRWECLFISSSDSELTNKWVDYLLEMPNRLVGIYMSPVESFGLFQALQSGIKDQSKVKNKRNDLYCLVLQNQVSGIRQIVFSSQGIVFTRVVNYDFSQPDFLEKYEHDLYSTFEYLKRIYPSLSMTELDIVNIFSDKVLSLLNKINNPEVNFVNYTPNDVAVKIGYPSLANSDSGFCDFLVSKLFSQKRKILKFTTPKIDVLEKFFLSFKISHYLNLGLLLMIVGMGVITLLSHDRLAQLVETEESSKYSANQELAKLKKLAFEGGKINDEDKIVSAERVIDFGKIDEALNLKDKTFSDYYRKLKFIRNSDVKLDNFTYLIANFNNKSPSQPSSFQLTFSGQISNSSGDIDDLFRGFDSLTGSIKKSFTQVKYEELPRTLDFNTKYYNYPVAFTVTDESGAVPSNQPPQM